MDAVKAVENKTKGGKRLILVAVLFLLFVGIVGFFYWFFFMRNIVSTDDARLDSDLVNLAPQRAYYVDLQQIVTTLTETRGRSKNTAASYHTSDPSAISNMEPAI